MPKNTTILIIRHGEKPDSDGDVNLSPQGHSRSMAYVPFFKNHQVNGQPLKLNHMFAASDSKASHRPKQTAKHVAAEANLPLKTDYADEQYEQLAEHILQSDKYDNNHLLICWHHGKLLKLAQALGVDTSKLPASANWPTEWPGDVFGWLIRLVYDANGNVDYTQTACLPQNLMYDDYGQYPPATTVSSSSVTVSDGTTAKTTTTTTTPEGSNTTTNTSAV